MNDATAVCVSQTLGCLHDIADGLRHRQGPELCHQFAEIAAVHAHADRPPDTDWARIVQLYDELVALAPSPVVELNRAAAIAMADGPDRGLTLIDRIEGLDDYYLLHAARADLLRRGGRHEEAAASYRRALQLATNPVERSFFERRLAEVG